MTSGPGSLSGRHRHRGETCILKTRQQRGVWIPAVDHTECCLRRPARKAKGLPQQELVCPYTVTPEATGLPLHIVVGRQVWWLRWWRICLQSGDLGLISESGRCPGGGHGNPFQYSWLENPMHREAWQATAQSEESSRYVRPTPSPSPHPNHHRSLSGLIPDRIVFTCIYVPPWCVERPDKRTQIRSSCLTVSQEVLPAFLMLYKMLTVVARLCMIWWEPSPGYSYMAFFRFLKCTSSWFSRSLYTCCPVCVECCACPSSLVLLLLILRVACHFFNEGLSTLPFPCLNYIFSY